MKEYQYEIEWLQDMQEHIKMKEGYLPCMAKKIEIPVIKKLKNK